MPKKTTNPADDLKAAFAAFIDSLTDAALAKSEDVAEDTADEQEDDAPDYESMSLAALKKAAKEAGAEPDDLKGASKEDIIAFLTDEGDDDEDDDEDAEDEDSDEDEGPSREDLEEMDLKSLKALAKENGATAADLKGLDQDEIIELILGESEEDDAEDVEDDEDEDSEDDEEELTEDDLNDMSEKDLKALAKQMGVKVKKDAKKKQIIKALLDSADE